ncbi:MAG: aminodeoxychorismate/anthranilate synthase component II [Actinomycetaceae bacterium]|nr:aminodeoxychorismate/anthranilate synthase component II [Actinomycetaceae bacterium]
MTHILVIDNYDSFVYTIVDYLRLLGAQTTVVRNDAVKVEEAASFDGVLISPGPGTPSEAGISEEMIRYCAAHSIPLLGVCLGHQALAEIYGADVRHAPELMHGKTSSITHTSQGIFDGLPSPLTVTRYHSLAVAPPSVDEKTLSITSYTSNGIIMAIEHNELPLWGVQFHPESIMTEGGHRMLANWLRLCGSKEAIELSIGKTPLMSSSAT